MLKRFTTLSPQKNMLFLSFLLPLFVMMVIYATMGVYPFGNSTLLTVDLGQQYVDFFSYYRTTLLSDPSALFFSFTKSFGGEMLGLWAYYLMSPFNLIFLLNIIAPPFLFFLWLAQSFQLFDLPSQSSYPFI